MSVMTVPVATGNHNGYAVFGAAANANGTTFNPGTIYPFVGPHYDNNVIYVAWFYFRIQNLPQGTTINSTVLNLRTNNGYTGGLNQHIYLAVENNLTPTAAGTAVANGTLGTQPWQRLGRQTAAVTLLGNRAGPTHAKAGQTLATYGAHVRDTSALIYRAYADGRTFATGAWTQTDNFGPALQVLVNDPSWNSTDQYIMVYAFSDASTGTAFNVGNLGGFTWDNGQVGTAGYGNGGGQLRFYSVASSIPEIVVDYVSASAPKSGFFTLMR